MNKIGIRQFVIYFSIFIFQFSSIFGQSNPLNLPQKLYFNQAYIYEYSSSVIPKVNMDIRGRLPCILMKRIIAGCLQMKVMV
jgi:hypothetical protein